MPYAIFCCINEEPLLDCRYQEDNLLLPVTRSAFDGTVQPHGLSSRRTPSRPVAGNQRSPKHLAHGWPRQGSVEPLGAAAGTLSSERKCEILGVLLIGLTAFLFLALVTDDYQRSGEQARVLEGLTQVPNLLGTPGAALAGGLSVAVGDASHVLYVITFIWGLMLLSHRALDRLLTRLVGMILITGAVAGLLQIDAAQGASNPLPGGAFGAFVADSIIVPYFGVIGSNVIGATMMLIGILLATDFLFIHIFVLAQRTVMHTLRGHIALVDAVRTGWEHLQIQRETSAERRAERESDRADRMLALEAAREARAVREAEAEAKRRSLLRTRATPPQQQEIAVEERPVRKPRVAKAAVPVVDEPAFDAEAVPLEVEAVAPGAQQAPATAPRPRMNIRTAPPPAARPVVQELPFDAVPDLPAPAAEPAFSEEYIPGALTIDLDHDDVDVLEMPAAIEAEVEVEEETEAGGVFDLAEADADDAGLEDEVPEVPVAVSPLEIAAKAAAAAALRSAGRTSAPDSSPQRRVVRTRRRMELEELPPDYQYPKRYSKPAVDMLDLPEPRVIDNLEEKLRETGLLLEETLQTFGIDARVVEVVRGPTITRFELEPAAGIKVARFMALADDIALALKAHRVRIEAPIPGKGRVGIEVPNQERDQVLLRELLESPDFRKGKGILKLGLGKDITGEVSIADLTKMPHLLVAGATGAGKTVCVKALLASLLFQHGPDDLQLILIDPKMVELSIFNDIPHLITPVVVDPKKAATALGWLINEMEERYRLFAELRTRNIEVYNKSVENGEIEVEPVEGEEEPENQPVHVIRKLPYIVCIIDELADLMMLARAEVEDAIARLAQLARAVGIHLIIATQRPSVDVLTGVIKANFPARLSFQVSSRVDSRCILDEIGAERLIGMGDLLYLPAGQAKPLRIQGAFVSDEEMFALISYLKTQAPPQYRDEIERFGKGKEQAGDLEDFDDPLFEEAVAVVMETGQASISMVQRRLRVGYTRAARLIDVMELKGIVGPHTGSKAREILVHGPARDDVA